MSKPIKLTEQHIEQCRAEFEKALRSSRLAGGSFSFSKSFVDTGDSARVIFTPNAWTKMLMLIFGFGTEVAWHGVATRSDDSGANEYVISDVLVYPQEVSGVTVDMNTEKYAKWLQDNDEDERFFNIRMQGHSHVNMGVTPSSVDLHHQEEILSMLGEDGFYIFMIFNKSLKYYVKIYDLKKNLLFEDTDITVDVDCSDGTASEFLQEAKSIVTSKTYQSNITVYGGAKTTVAQHPNTSMPSAPALQTAYTPATTTTVTATNGGENHPVSEKPRSKIGAGWAGANAQQSLYDDDDDPYAWHSRYR